MDIKNYISSGIIEAYVLGTASQEERSILECVLQNNKEVQEAVFDMQQTLEKLATEQAIQPPAHLKERILQKIEFSSTGDEEKAVVLTENISQKPKNNTTRWAMAATVAALITAGFLGYELQQKNSELDRVAQNNIQLNSKLSEAEQMNTILKNSKKIELKGVPTHPDMLAEVYWDSSKRVYLDVKDMPAAPAGKQYQLWAIVDGKPVDLGLYDFKKDSAVQPMKIVESAQAFAITLENEGGSASPTMEQMIVMGEV